MLDFSFDMASGIPLVEQIVAGVCRRVDDRLLRPGAQLPSIRRFSAHHRVSRFTVIEAYDRLVAQGYVKSRRGAGFFVASRPTPAGQRPRPLAPDRAIDVVWLLRQGLEHSADKRLLVGSGWLPADWMDMDGVKRNLRALSRRADARMTAYGIPQGYLPLRQQLQIKLGEFGIAADPRHILLTHGATHALDLVARYLVKPGDCVFVDDPGYWSLFGNLRMQGAQLVGVPRTLDGPDPAALAALLEQHRPKVFFTHTVLHNPTATNINPATAHQVLKLAERHNFLIVEDDTYSDFQPGPATRLAALDQLERVIYIGSFSKTLSADLRVGFIACQDDLAAALTDVKLLSSLTTSECHERLVYLMLIEGHYRKYIERMHGRLGTATAKAMRMLERVGFQPYAEPEGGLFIWATRADIDDAAVLADSAARAGILLAPGNVFRPQTQASPWLRFNVTFANDSRLERFLAEGGGKPAATAAGAAGSGGSAGGRGR